MHLLWLNVLEGGHSVAVVQPAQPDARAVLVTRSDVAGAPVVGMSRSCDPASPLVLPLRTRQQGGSTGLTVRSWNGQRDGSLSSDTREFKLENRGNPTNLTLFIADVSSGAPVFLQATELAWSAGVAPDREALLKDPAIDAAIKVAAGARADRKSLVIAASPWRKENNICLVLPGIPLSTDRMAIKVAILRREERGQLAPDAEPPRETLLIEADPADIPALNGVFDVIHLRRQAVPGRREAGELAALNRDWPLLWHAIMPVRLTPREGRPNHRLIKDIAAPVRGDILLFRDPHGQVEVTELRRQINGTPHHIDDPERPQGKPRLVLALRYGGRAIEVAKEVSFDDEIESFRGAYNQPVEPLRRPVDLRRLVARMEAGPEGGRVVPLLAMLGQHSASTPTPAAIVDLDAIALAALAARWLALLPKHGAAVQSALRVGNPSARDLLWRMLAPQFENLCVSPAVIADWQVVGGAGDDAARQLLEFRASGIADPDLDRLDAEQLRGLAFVALDEDLGRLERLLAARVAVPPAAALTESWLAALHHFLGCVGRGAPFADMVAALDRVLRADAPVPPHPGGGWTTAADIVPDTAVGEFLKKLAEAKDLATGLEPHITAAPSRPLADVRRDFADWSKGRPCDPALATALADDCAAELTSLGSGTTAETLRDEVKKAVSKPEALALLWMLRKSFIQPFRAALDTTPFAALGLPEVIVDEPNFQTLLSSVDDPLEMIPGVGFATMSLPQTPDFRFGRKSLEKVGIGDLQALDALAIKDVLVARQQARGGNPIDGNIDAVVLKALAIIVGRLIESLLAQVGEARNLATDEDKKDRLDAMRSALEQANSPGAGAVADLARNLELIRDVTTGLDNL